jgi:hypothetical protein
MQCENCGGEITMARAVCPHCTRPTTRVEGPRDAVMDDPAMRMLLPIGRSGWAIAAGYAGLFAFTVFPAPLALIFGILALRDMKKHPEKRGMGREIFGLVIGGVGTCVLLFAVSMMLIEALGK